MYNKLFKLQEKLFKAFAHHRRLEIINLLRNQELDVTQIHTMLALPQANISQHLHILKESNIVTTVKKGRTVSYTITEQTYTQVVDMIRELVVKNNQDLDSAARGQLETQLQQLVPLTLDVVCKMRLSPKTAGFMHTHKGKKFYFCASRCLELFKRKPETYVKSR